MNGNSVDNPHIANMTRPVTELRVNGMTLNIRQLHDAAVAKFGTVQAGDVLSVSGHRNGRGQWVPDYETVRIERTGNDQSAN